MLEPSDVARRLSKEINVNEPWVLILRLVQENRWKDLPLVEKRQCLDRWTKAVEAYFDSLSGGLLFATPTRALRYAGAIFVWQCAEEQMDGLLNALFATDIGIYFALLEEQEPVTAPNVGDCRAKFVQAFLGDWAA